MAVGEGRITVYSGCMFSGKTDALVRALINAEKYTRLKVQAFKPIIDNRGEGLDVISSKNGNSFPAISILTDKPEAILSSIEEGTRIVGIEEAQFFPATIVTVVTTLLLKGIDVSIAGLPTDFRNETFGSMGDFLAMADEVNKCFALCTAMVDNDTVCGDQATRTQRIINGQPADYEEPVILVGGSEQYEARCRVHHIVPRKLQS